MKHDQIQVLNYCTHAIEELRQDKQMLATEAPASAEVYARLITVLEKCVKFILPNCCNLLDPEDMRQAHLDIMRLPFQSVAFEVPWETEDGVTELGGLRQSPATKRIALCWEVQNGVEIIPGLNQVLTNYPEGGIAVIPIFWGPEFSHWSVGFGGMFVPFENTLEKNMSVENVPAPSRIANQAIQEAGLASKKGKQFHVEPFVLLPEFFAQIAHESGGRDQAFAQVMMDSRDEVSIMIQACSVINCANVSTSDVLASVALNKKRQQKGKLPFFSYKVLVLSEGQVGSIDSTNRGNHSSPRMHLRRGHLRRLDNKVVWVRPSIVKADGTRGLVGKDYAVL